jgi:hypothetical protein
LNYLPQIVSTTAVNPHFMASAATVLGPHQLLLLAAIKVGPSHMLLRLHPLLLTLHLALHLGHRPLRALGPYLTLHRRMLHLRPLHLRCTLKMLLTLRLRRTLRVLLLTMYLLRPLNVSLWRPAASLMTAAATAATIAASALAFTLGKRRACTEQNNQK